MAVSGRLRPPKWEVNLRTGRACVDIEDAGEDVLHGAERLVDVSREDRGRKAVLDAVDDIDGFVQRVNGNQRGDRPENLFLCDTHVGPDLIEDRGLVEEPSRQFSFTGDLPTSRESCAFCAPHLDVAADRLQLAFSHHRPDVRGRLQAVTQAHATRPGNETLA